MRILSLTFILTALLFADGFSQSLYKEGFILNSPFDTIRGQVKYKSYNKASVSFEFKDNDGNVKTYFPKDLFGYGIEDQLFFVSKKIGSENERFLEVVYQGTVILYAYRDKNQRNHFYLENPTTGQLEILTQKTIKRRSKTIVIKAYQEVLKEMLPKSELVADEIESVEYSHNGLSNFLLDYDMRYAQFQGRIFQGFKKRWPPKIGIYGHTGFAYLNLNGFESKESTNSYGIGVKFQKEVSRGTGRLYLDLDISVHHEKFDDLTFKKKDFANEQSIISNGFNIALFAVDLGVQGPYEVKNNLNLERYMLDFPLNIKYFFPSEKWTFSLNGGIHPSITLSESGNIDGQVIQNETVILGVNSRLDLDNFRPGVNFGFGLYFKTNGTLFLDFQHSPNWLDQGNANFSYSNVRLGYLFTK